VKYKKVPAKYIKTESDKQAIIDGCYFDDSEPKKVKGYIEKFLCNSKGDERGTTITLLDWQYEEVILPLYGWRKANGKMRFKECQLWIPKKNGKSFLCSALASYHLAKEKGGEIYCIAGTEKQAKIVYNESANQVNLNPILKKNMRCTRSSKTIENEANGTKFTTLSSTPSQTQGYDANLVICDEIASWGAHHRDIWENVSKANMSRIEKNQVGLIFVASTAQFDTSHLGFELFSYMKEIIAGSKVDTTVLPIVYALDLDEDWTDEKNWAKVNPGIGHTVGIEFFREEFAKAKNLPNAESGFRTLNLNQFYGSAKNWISTTLWQSCFEEYTEEDFRGEPCIISIDASRKHDLTCVMLTFKRGDLIYSVPRFYSVRAYAMQKAKLDSIPYLAWEKQGLITLCDDSTVDFADVRAQIIQDCKDFDVLEIRYDPYALQETVKILEQEFGLNVVEVNQSPSVMSAPTAFLEQLITAKKVRHNNNPILNYCLSNVAIKTDNQERIMLDKTKSKGRIDGISALVQGLTYWHTEDLTEDLPIFFFLS